MQRTLILVLSLFVTVTFGDGNDEFAEEWSQKLSLPKADVQTCINKTNVQNEDVQKVIHMKENEVFSLDDVAKVGCLFACLGQKKKAMSGTRVNVEKLKEYYILSGNPSHKEIADFYRTLDMCNDRVKHKSNECEVAIYFYHCVYKYDEIPTINSVFQGSCPSSTLG